MVAEKRPAGHGHLGRGQQERGGHGRVQRNTPSQDVVNHHQKRDVEGGGNQGSPSPLETERPSEERSQKPEAMFRVRDRHGSSGEGVEGEPREPRRVVARHRGREENTDQFGGERHHERRGQEARTFLKFLDIRKIS